MKTSKRILALLLAALTLLSMLTLTACGNTSWSAKYNGKEVPGGIYPLAAMIAYQNVCYTYGPVPLTENLELVDGSKITIAEYINQSAKDSLENYVATKAMFEELGLSYSEEDYNAYMDLYGNYYSAQSEIYKKNGIGKDTFYELVIAHTLRHDALVEHFTAKYEDSASDMYMSDGDIKKHFDENYIRFNYMMYYAIDAEGKYLTEDSAEYKAELKKLTDITEKKLSIKDYTAQAKAYTDIAAYKEGGTMDPVDAETAFADTTMGDVYQKISTLEFGESDVYTFSLYDDSYNTCYAICAAQRIKPDLDGNDYLEKADEIISSVCLDNLTADLDAYYAELNVTENKTVIKNFSIDKLVLDGFTSIDPNA